VILVTMPEGRPVRASISPNSRPEGDAIAMFALLPAQALAQCRRRIRKSYLGFGLAQWGFLNASQREALRVLHLRNWGALRRTEAQTMVQILVRSSRNFSAQVDGGANVEQIKGCLADLTGEFNDTPGKAIQTTRSSRNSKFPDVKHVALGLNHHPKELLKIEHKIGN
jgi:hypothetical protein